MIARMVVWGAARRQALARMRQALAQYRVVGVSNNIDFLARLVAVPSFANAELDTGLIEREQALLFPPLGEVPADVWLLAALAELLREKRLSQKKAARAVDPDSPWRALDGWRLNGRTQRKLAFRLVDTVQDILVAVVAGGHEVQGGSHRVFPRGTLGADSELQAPLRQ